MKLTLKNGTVLDVESVEESYYPRNTQGVVLSVRMNTADSIDSLREAFAPEAVKGITVGEGGSAKTITGYARIDSIRKTYDGAVQYDTTVDLVKQA